MKQTIIANPHLDYREQAKLIFNNLDVSETTRQDYQYRIGLFADFVISWGFHQNTFLEFKRYLTSRSDLAVATKNKNLATARIFLKELNRTGRLPRDITQNIKSFKEGRKHKRAGLNDDEVALLADRLRELSPTTANTRIKAIVSLLILNGLRQCEVVRLDVNDVDIVNKTAFIIGKGEQDKEMIYLHPQTARLLREYLKVNKIGSGPLFTSHSNHGRHGRLTTRGLRHIVKAVFRQLRIDKPLHGCRHYFTTKLIQNYKSDLTQVARLTRHRSLETLQIYDDSIKQKADLPRFYAAFENVNL